MKIIKLFMLFVLPLSALAQQNESGINFIHNKTWSEIKKQAKKEKKYIFVDCFTTWCGPCKYMSRTTFTNDSVGIFMNKNFVSYKAQMDTSSKDNDDVKKSYADFALINKQFDIQVYPTLLYLSPNGEIVHKLVGAMSANQFIEASKKALNPETQYYSLLKQFNANKSDAELNKKLMTAAADAYDDATPYFEAYIKTQKSMFTKENIEYIKLFSSTTTDTGFKMILNNPNRFDDVEGAGKANELLVSVIVNDYRRKLYRKKESGAVEINEEVKSMIRNKYPRQANQVFALAKVYQFSAPPEDWKNYESTLMDYMKEYGEMTNSGELLNEFSWNIFLHGANEESVKQAQVWSKKSLTGTNVDNPMFMDTYANILYRLGNVGEAIRWEAKALKLEKEDKESYQKTIEKMKAGEKTWKE